MRGSQVLLRDGSGKTVDRRRTVVDRVLRSVEAANDGWRSCQRNHAVLNAVEIDFEHPSGFLVSGSALVSSLFSSFLVADVSVLAFFGFGCGLGASAPTSSLRFVAQGWKRRRSSAVKVIRYTRVVLGFANSKSTLPNTR